MFATVNASGSGAIVIADSSGRAIGCTWVASPRLVQVEVRNWTSFVSSVDHASGFPAPAGRAVFSTLTGISQAIRLGASLYPPPNGYPFPPSSDGYPGAVIARNAARVLGVLLADGVKAALTYYTGYCLTYSSRCEAAGIALCNSQHRTVQEHWRFGDAYYLGIPAIMLNLVFGSYALWVLWRVRKSPRVKGINPFKIVEGCKIGMDTPKVEDVGNAVGDWDFRHGRLRLRREGLPVAGESESVPLNLATEGS
jgi:hypothetical protein